jgi:starvation-inducible outer membrane lipoprotein
VDNKRLIGTVNGHSSMMVAGCMLLQFLILGWCQSQRDLVKVMSLVNQVIAAYAPHGGTTIVVMTQREKLEMEDLFRWVRGGPSRHAFSNADHTTATQDETCNAWHAACEQSA